MNKGSEINQLKTQNTLNSVVANSTNGDSLNPSRRASSQSRNSSHSSILVDHSLSITRKVSNKRVSLPAEIILNTNSAPPVPVLSIPQAQSHVSISANKSIDKLSKDTETDDSAPSNSKKKLSKADSSVIGSSLNLSTDFLGKLLKTQQHCLKVITSTQIYLFFRELTISTKAQIYFLTIVHVFDLIIIVVLGTFIAKDLTLPSIGYYNLIHAILSSLGKISFTTGLAVTHLICKEYVARSFIKSSKGVPLLLIAARSTKFNPSEGRTIRKLFFVSLILLEVVIWAFILKIQWIPVDTELGEFGCIPATYTSKPILLNNVPGFLAGDASLATIYNYGLPLQDGLIGGWAAWPLSAPSTSFQVEGRGVVYAYAVTCGDLRLTTSASILNQNETGISFRLLRSEHWTDVYNAFVEVTFPPNTHNWASYSNQSVQQRCVLKYIMGSGTIKFTFVSDEWEMVTGGQMDSIQLQGTIITQNMAQQYFFDDVANSMGSIMQYANIVDWFIEAFIDCMNSTKYQPTQAGVISSLFQWGQNGGVYDLNKTWQGISGAIGSMSHYILMQYNGSTSATCLYYGTQGSGKIDVPSAFSQSLLGITYACFAIEIMQLLRWALTSGGDPLTDLVCIVLNSPLLILHHFRETVTSMIPDIKNNDHSTRSINNHLLKIMVRFGEDKRTRGESVGTLIISEPKKIVAMNERRIYATMSSSDRDRTKRLACQNLIKKVPCLTYEVNDGKEDDYYSLVTSKLCDCFYRPGVAIIKQSEIGDKMYFLLNGKVKISVNGQDVGNLTDGSFFGG
ncbi:anaphase-promoting complex subunit Hcn1 [Physocladia obscura]|uniref:Anaphase-promoting complex subunit Hcn1 n=1 Tax=Physocladia obscura TaxID=109957 RepID=A0AAD5TCA1_9FUNG|nr:anaphase-promoting complex subunit Hcn1 [Physocladia obscura]